MIEFDGIGTHWWIKIYDDIKVDLEPEIISIVKQFENNYSRFLSDSFISRLNHQKSITSFPGELFEILDYSEKVRNMTNGYFNIFVGKVLENSGYDKDYSFKAKSPESISEDQFILLSPNNIQISDNARIDLGGIGKGWLVDKVAGYLKNMGIKHFFINAGGDIYSTSEFKKPINFALENPLDKTEMIGSIDILNQSIASSSSNRRTWEDKSQTYHHLIDPKNGKSANNKVAGVFTLGNNCLEADIASTIIFVSPEDIWEKVSKELNVKYIVVFEDGSYFRSEGYSAVLN